MLLAVVLIFLMVFPASYFLVWLVHRYSKKHSVLDMPNERSSHTEPTATGGGLAISICLLVGIIIIWHLELLGDNFIYAVSPTLVIIAITGWFDDHQHIRTVYRGIIYFSAALWVTIVIGGFSSLNLGGHIVQTGVLGIILALLGIVWLTNLYNFMDGIDGLAAIEAITTAVAGSLLFFISGLPGPAIMCLVLTVATLAYLVWNWPPARIFMGDVGSCPLGFFFAVLAVWSHSAAGPSVYVWLILLSVFIADATYTLFLRILRGQEWYSAHRSHAYQKLVQMGYTHKQVSSGVLVFNLVFLWPGAYLANSQVDLALYLTMTVYVFLAIVWGTVQYQSGRLLTGNRSA